MIRDRITPDVPRDPSSYSYAEDWQRDPEPVHTWRRPVAIALGAAAVLVLSGAWWLG